MRRRSQRISSGSAATPKHKRAASGAMPPSAETSRTKKLKATPTKSQYFKTGIRVTNEPEDDDFPSDDDESSVGGDDASDFDDGQSPSELSSGDDQEDNVESDSDDEPKKRKKSTPKSQPSSAAVQSKGAEIWRPGVKTGLGPGTQVVIKKPKARAAGKIPYQDDTIHPNTLLFLADLKANNDRQWLKSK